MSFNVCKLSQIGTTITGKTPSKNNPEDWGDIMPFVTPTDYKNYGKKASTSIRGLSDKGKENLKNKVLPKDSVMVTCIGSDLGKVAMNEVPVVTNQQINAIVPNSDVHSSFLYYALVSKYRLLKVLGGSGTAVPIINKSTFESIEIPLPPLQEQKAIAEVLSSLDDKIELLQKQNETLEALAQTLFRHWFIEEADDSWGKGTLNDIFEVIENGKRPKGGIKDIPFGIPSIGAENVKNIGVYDYTKEKLVSVDFFNSMKKGIIEQGDILVYKDGGTPGNFIPKFSMVGCGFPHTVACINEHVFRCKPKPNLRSFAFGYLNSAYCKWELEERGTGAAIPGINSTQFKSVPVIIPSESTLTDYESKVGPLYDKILINSSNCRTLSDLRDTLLPKLMSGQVRVKLD